MATILVVDDYPMNRDYLITLLSYQKHHLLEAADGLQALDIVRKEPVDLIICDILMPTVGGYEFVQTLRADAMLEKIAIIFYSATYRKNEAKLIAKSCGVDIVISKPAEPEEILDQVNKILGQTSAGDNADVAFFRVKNDYWADTEKNFNHLLKELSVTNKYLDTLIQPEKLGIVEQDKFIDFIGKVKQLHSNGKKITLILELGFRLITERDPLRMLKLFTQMANNIIKCHSATVGFIDNTQTMSGLFCTTSVTDIDNSYCGQKCDLDHTTLSSVILDQDVIHLSNISEKGLLSHSSGMIANRAFLGVPLVSNGTCHGIFYLIGKEDNAGFSEEDKDIAMTMAAKLAILYENLQHYNVLQQHAAKLQLEIAERKKTENKLRCSEERLKLALEAAHMNVWEWDIKTNEIVEFGYFDPISRYKPTIQGGSYECFLEHVHPEDRDHVIASVNQALSEKSFLNVEFRANMHDGSIQWVGVRAQTYLDEQENPKRMVGVGLIITERKDAEKLAQQHQSELAYIARVNSMGEITSALAHELNQPLAAISAYVTGCIHRLKNGLDQKDQIIETMKLTNQNVKLAGEIIHRMKNFLRKGNLNYELVSINNVVTEALGYFNTEISERPAKIQCEFAKNIPLVRLDKIQIEQVILNLVRNGLEAMLSAETSQPKLFVSTELLSSQTIAVTIKDVGPGIEEGIINKLFIPYFTTKAKGMGLGLTICQTIIEAHGGKILAHSLPTGGACFQFTLPVIAEESVAYE